MISAQIPLVSLEDGIQLSETDQNDKEINHASCPGGTITKRLLVGFAGSDENEYEDEMVLDSPDSPWYKFVSSASAEVGVRKECPFKQFHHAGLASEFLRYPLRSTTNLTGGSNAERHILAGMNDLSSGVAVKLQFIVNNLKDCHGIWRELFLQKLNAMLIHADQATVQTVLCKDEFKIVSDMISDYCKQTKCSMVFRYWCFFYNAFSRNLIPALSSTLKTQLMAKFQSDLSLVAKNSCRCQLSKQYGSSDLGPNEEHSVIGKKTQFKVISVLIHFLVFKVGNEIATAYDIYKEAPPEKNIVGFIKETLVPFYLNLHEINKSSVQPDQNGDERLDNVLTVELISHLLIAFASLPYPSLKELFSTTIQFMLDMGCLTAAMSVKETLLNLFNKESEALEMGADFRLKLVVPELKIGFQTAGFEHVSKCIMDLIGEVEYDMLTTNELMHLQDVTVNVRRTLKESCETYSNYPDVSKSCVALRMAVRSRIQHPRNVRFTSSGLGLDEIALQSESDEISNDSNASATSRSRLTPTKPKSEVPAADAKLDIWRHCFNWTNTQTKLRRDYEYELASSRIGMTADDGTKQNVPRWLQLKTILTEMVLKCIPCCIPR